MVPYFGKIFGNPGAIHYFGQQAQAAVNSSREKIANFFGLRNYQQVIFAGSATEANNLVIRGVLKGKPRIIVSAIEHKSILKTCRVLEKDGLAELVYLSVSKNGIVDLEKLKSSLNENTILVSVMYVNNEIGSLQPIKEIAQIINSFKREKISFAETSQPPEHGPSFPLFHTDAVQAVQFFNCDLENLGVDLMTVSAHKIYGPKGIGALLLGNSFYNSGFKLKPIITGGGQEFGLRGGTENVPYIAGFAKAVELVVKSRGRELKRMRQLTGRFYQKLKKVLPPIEINGSLNPNLHSPHILNIYFPGCQAKDLLVMLDLKGIAVSTGSACQARVSKPPFVLTVMELPEERTLSSLRFSFGRFTKQEEVDRAARICIKIIKKLL